MKAHWHEETASQDERVVSDVNSEFKIPSDTSEHIETNESRQELLGKESSFKSKIITLIIMGGGGYVGVGGSLGWLCGGEFWCGRCCVEVVGLLTCQNKIHYQGHRTAMAV